MKWLERSERVWNKGGKLITTLSLSGAVERAEADDGAVARASMNDGADLLHTIGANIIHNRRQTHIGPARKRPSS